MVQGEGGSGGGFSIEKRTARGYKYPVVKTTAAGGVDHRLQQG